MTTFNLKLRLDNLIKALKLERAEEISRYESKAIELSVQEKIISGICLYPLEFKSHSFTDSGQNILSFAHHQPDNSNFKIGQPVKVFNQEKDFVKGTVRLIKSNQYEIITTDDSVLDWIKKGKIGLQILADTKSIDYYLDHLTLIPESSNHFIKILYQTDNYTDLSADYYRSDKLNDSQTSAVNQILGQNPVSIIHGPPGTGKTTCLIAAIETLNTTEQTIWITAPTHAALDHISKQLIQKDIDFLRIGNDLKVDDHVEPYLLDSKIQNDKAYQLVKSLKQTEETLRKKAFQFKRNFGQKEYQERKAQRQELKNIRKDIRKLRHDIARFHIENSNIIIGTFIGLKQVESDLGTCDYLIIDEAGQAIEPAIWLLSVNCKKLVLAGDHLQLPPTIFSQKAIDLGLNLSVLEIAEKTAYPTSFLNIQYRMQDSIMQFSNSFFYNNKLQSADHLVPDESGSKTNIDFIDTAGCGFEETKNELSGSISNQNEIDIISKLIKDLDLSNKSIGIISPYRSQVELIKTEISEYDKKVKTIDSFQGQERDIIIISMVRSNPNAEIGFLKDYRRMNVAMTRTKRHLFIIGDSTTFGHDKFYSAFLDYVESNGNYRSAWEFM